MRATAMNVSRGAVPVRRRATNPSTTKTAISGRSVETSTDANTVTSPAHASCPTKSAIRVAAIIPAGKWLKGSLRRTTRSPNASASSKKPPRIHHEAVASAVSPIVRNKLFLPDKTAVSFSARAHKYGAATTSPLPHSAAADFAARANERRPDTKRWPITMPPTAMSPAPSGRVK